MLIDTGIVCVAGINHQLVLMIDWYSRVAHCELLPMRFMSSLPWFLERAFEAFGGVPHTIQSDNGIGLTCGFIGQYSSVQRYAFAQGVERWEYIPVAEATRNGRIEKLVDTVKSALTDAYDIIDSLDAARLWLSGWMREYNTHRWHHGISRRCKGGLRTPSDLGTYVPLAPSASEVISVSKARPASGLVGFKRLVVDGILPVQYPVLDVVISHGLSGHYATLWVDVVTLAGFVEWADKEGSHTVATVPLHARQLRVVATVTCGMENRFAPVTFDVSAWLKGSARLRKSRLPRPGSTVSGLSYVWDNDHFLIVEDETQEVVYDSSCGVVPDHASEILGVR